MSAVDLIIVAFTLVMAVWGYTQGLLVGALSLVGFVGGAILGSRLGPVILAEGSRSPYAPLVTLGSALVLGGILTIGGEAIGSGLRRRLGGRLGALDGAGGAVLVGCIGLALAWIAGAAFLHAPGARDVRDDLQSSTILRRLNQTLPPSGPVLNALARFDPLPRLADGPRPDVRPPSGEIARDDKVRAAGASVVRVLGTACGLGVQGSGWIANDGIVVTNAHVVAGQEDTTVQLEGEGERLDAEAIHFDPDNDLAILRVPGVEGVGALELAPGAEVGTAGAVLGFPENGGFDVEPARLGDTVTAMSQDAYGRGPIRREITSLRGDVRSGNSGGPMVDGEGRVLTTIFAAGVEGGSDIGYGVPDQITQDALGRAEEPVSTGPCSK